MRFEINRNNKLLMKQQERLATGLKNPRAEDDVASFSIAAKLNARIAGISQAETNVADVKGTLDVMERSLTTILDLLNIVRKNVIQAANSVIGENE